MPFVSSIFLRRLLHPGVHHNIVLRATLLDYNRHYTDSEFHSLTIDGLRKEIISLIEHEVVSGFVVAVLFSIHSLSLLLHGKFALSTYIGV